MIYSRSRSVRCVDGLDDLQWIRDLSPRLVRSAYHEVGDVRCLFCDVLLRLRLGQLLRLSSVDGKDPVLRVRVRQGFDLRVSVRFRG